LCPRGKFLIELGRAHDIRPVGALNVRVVHNPEGWVGKDEIEWRALVRVKEFKRVSEDKFIFHHDISHPSFGNAHHPVLVHEWDVFLGKYVSKTECVYGNIILATESCNFFLEGRRVIKCDVNGFFLSLA